MALLKSAASQLFQTGRPHSGRFFHSLIWDFKMLQVRVFRNLSRDAWSVQARVSGAWRTVAHTAAVTVSGATFYHSEAARLRCAAKHVREVHAWIAGGLSAVSEFRLVEKWQNPEIQSAFAAAS